MAVEEALERAGFGLLEDLQGGPFLEKVTGQTGSQITANRLDSLGEILLQRRAQALDMAGAQVHRFAPILTEAAQEPGFDRVGVKRPE